MLAINKLKKLADGKGIDVIDKGNGHIQLVGTLLVNYYPNSKAKSAYVAGTVRAHKNVTIEQAIGMCFNQPSLRGDKDKRKGSSRAKRKRLIDKGITTCHWCSSPIDLDTSTLEHIIPLGIGGLDNANNITLACKKCNEERGCDMPELLA